MISLKGLHTFTLWLELGGNVWRAEEYFHFVIMFMLGMGISFEVPVVILTLVRLGVISHETLVKSRMYLFVGNLVVCAFITPDAISTIFMVIPVQALMEICIMISRHWERQRRIEEAKRIAAEKALEEAEAKASTEAEERRRLEEEQRLVAELPASDELESDASKK
jgi:sec-independent protein translocase protein TatC